METKEKTQKKPEKIEKNKAPIQKAKEESEDWMKTDGQLAIDVYQTKYFFCHSSTSSRDKTRRLRHIC